MPEGTVYVGRPTKWGNPYTPNPSELQVALLRHYRDLILSTEAELQIDLSELRGKDLACWCVDWDPAEGPAPGICHAEILLELANAGER